MVHRKKSLVSDATANRVFGQIIQRSRYDPSGWAKVSAPDIHKALDVPSGPIGLTTVQYAIDKLIDEGRIERIRVGTTRGKPSIYRILDPEPL